MASPQMVRRGEYAARGDYHKHLDPTWDYYPTYIAKLAFVRRYLDPLPPTTRVLDAGCGEGVLVDEYASRLAIVGVDANYSSERVSLGSITSLPFEDGAFDRALCLDVLEHLSYEDQPRALAELHRRVGERRRAPHLGSQSRAPAIAAAVPAARAPDSDGIRIQASRAIVPSASTSISRIEPASC